MLSCMAIEIKFFGHVLLECFYYYLYVVILRIWFKLLFGFILLFGILTEIVKRLNNSNKYDLLLSLKMLKKFY